MDNPRHAALGAPVASTAVSLATPSRKGAHQGGGADSRKHAAASGGARRAEAPGRRRAAPDPMARKRRGVVLLAELLLTSGLLVLLYFAWYLLVDDAVLAHDQTRAADALERDFTAQVAAGGPAATTGPTAVPTPAPGTAFAVIRIPRFGSSWRRPIIEGTSLDELSRGVGHYAGTALPGQVGNFAVAGHRLTHGSAFTLIDHLQPGDPVAVHTATDWYIYRVTGSEIINPDQVAVLAPVPWHVGTRPTQRLMTLTSCNPLYGHTQRYIVYARLDSVRPDTAGPPDLSTAVS